MILSRLLVACTLIAPLSAADGLKAEVEDLLAKSQAWLAAQQQDNGAFAPGAKFSVGITAMAIDALQAAPAYYKADDAKVTKAFEFLWSFQQADGGIYAVDEGLGNYGTSLTLMAMASADKLEGERTKRMQDYLFGLQNTNEASIAVGGIGYGSRGEGHEDLSNTAMALEGLRQSGVPASDPHMQKALAFLERCQDLSSHNDQPWAKDSGGAVYSPDETKADGSWNPKKAQPGERPSELKPYGSMTYQLISSYVALDLRPGDPRLDAALGWIKKHYQFDVNPGIEAGRERQGLFYYYMAMAKTFDVLDYTTMDLPDGRTVDWRRDLFEAIKANATEVDLPDGTKAVVWMNSADRWAEGIPNVTAGYLIKALKRIHQSL
mgnify:CR=1 FL=1